MSNPPVASCTSLYFDSLDYCKIDMIPTLILIKHRDISVNICIILLFRYKDTVPLNADKTYYKAGQRVNKTMNPTLWKVEQVIGGSGVGGL